MKRLVGLLAIALVACSSPAPTPSRGPVEPPGEPVDDPPAPNAPDAAADPQPEPMRAPAPTREPVDSGAPEGSVTDAGHPPADAGAPDVAQHDAAPSNDPCRQWSTAACGLPTNSAERSVYVPDGCSNPDELRCEPTFRPFSHGNEWCCLPPGAS